MARTARPDFGAVVARHLSPPEDRVRLAWIALFVFGAVFLLIPPFILDPRPGPPRAVYFLIWFAFLAAAIRSLVARYLSTPTVVLEHGLFLPAYLPRHWLKLRSRAVLFSDLVRVELDNTAFRAGTHLFETTRGPKRCAKAYFPPAKRFAEQMKQLAPDLEVEFVDRRGNRRRYAPVVARRPRKEKPKGERSDAK